MNARESFNNITQKESIFNIENSEKQINKNNISQEFWGNIIYKNFDYKNLTPFLNEYTLERVKNIIDEISDLENQKKEFLLKEIEKAANNIGY